MSNLVIKLNSSELSRSLARLSALSPKLSTHLADKACLSIAIKAHKTIPVVSAATIQAQMEQSKLVSGKKSSLLTRITVADSIVLASMHPGSRFNRETGGVFARVKPKLSGTTAPIRRLEFWEWVKSRSARMIKARKQSSGFYQLGAAVIRLIFSNTKSPVGMSWTGEAIAGGGNVGKAIGRVAGGSRARIVGGVAKASFWVANTEPDSKGKDTAISKVMIPKWQAAVDSETESINQYAEKLYTEAIKKAGLDVR